MTSGYRISLIRDPARGTSQLYLCVAWTSAFKQHFAEFCNRRYSTIGVGIGVGTPLDITEYQARKARELTKEQPSENV